MLIIIKMAWDTLKNDDNKNSIIHIIGLIFIPLLNIYI